MTDTRWATALHEAAHAVCAWALGVKVAAAVVISDGGFVVHAPTDVHDAAVIAAAGDVGAELADTCKPPKRRKHPTTTATAGAKLVAQLAAPSETALPLTHADWQIIREYAASVPDHSTWTARADHVTHRARVLVQLHAARVVALARALYRCGAVGQPALSELLPESRRVSRQSLSRSLKKC